MQNFAPRSPADLVRLVREYPLAWLVSNHGTRFNATPVPLIAETNEQDTIVSLFGHLPLGNPHVDDLRQNSQAIALFQGPQAYISPRLVSKPQWAPTWNFTIAKFDVEILFVPQETDDALRNLTNQLEADNSDPWTVEEMGARYDELARKVIGFRAFVRSVSPRFKHGQDETEQTFDEIVRGLNDSLMTTWMNRTVRGTA